MSQNPFLVNISSISKGESSIDSSIDEFNIFKKEIEQKEPKSSKKRNIPYYYGRIWK